MPCDYLDTRAGSDLFYFRFQWPADVFPQAQSRKKIVALGTSDRALARIMAAPLAADCKHMVRLWRSLRKANVEYPSYRQEPGTSVTHPDGTTSVVFEHKVIFLGADGIPTGKSLPNLVGPEGRTVTFKDDADRLQLQTLRRESRDILASIPTKDGQPRKRRTASPDEEDVAILEFYISGRHFPARIAREIMARYREFKTLCPNRSLRTATLEDATAFFQSRYKNGQGTSHNTAKKASNWLSQAIRYGAKHFKIETNGFEGSVPPMTRADSRREAQNKPADLTQSDMAAMRAYLPNLSREQQIFWVLAASTGMRPSEILSIRSELEVVKGRRRIQVGNKVVSTDRILPLPESVTSLPFFPEKIEGPLFPNAPTIDDVDRFRSYCVRWSNDMNGVLRLLGLKNGEGKKVIYSLRHRAASRLRDAECPDDIAKSILGHTNGEVHDLYGNKAVRVMHKWMAEIGY